MNMTVLDWLSNATPIVDEDNPARRVDLIIGVVSKEIQDSLDTKWWAYCNLRYNILQRVKFLVKRGNISLEEVENIARMDNNELLDCVGEFPLTDEEYPLW